MRFLGSFLNNQWISLNPKEKYRLEREANRRRSIEFLKRANENMFIYVCRIFEIEFY